MYIQLFKKKKKTSQMSRDGVWFLFNFLIFFFFFKKKKIKKSLININPTMYKQNLYQCSITIL